MLRRIGFILIIAGLIACVIYGRTPLAALMALGSGLVLFDEFGLVRGAPANDPFADVQYLRHAMPVYKARTLRARDLLLPMAAMLVTFVGFIYLNHADMGWLIGMSVAIIGLVASMYREARGDVRFTLAIALSLVAHVAVIGIAFHIWRSIPAKALSPLFYLDFIAMALLFPKLTGISFDANE